MIYTFITYKAVYAVICDRNTLNFSLMNYRIVMLHLSLHKNYAFYEH